MLQCWIWREVTVFNNILIHVIYNYRYSFQVWFLYDFIQKSARLLLSVCLLTFVFYLTPFQHSQGCPLYWQLCLHQKLFSVLRAMQGYAGLSLLQRQETEGSRKVSRHCLGTLSSRLKKSVCNLKIIYLLYIIHLFPHFRSLSFK